MREMTSWATVSFSKRNVICNYSLWTGKGLRTTDVETLTATKNKTLHAVVSSVIVKRAAFQAGDTTHVRSTYIVLGTSQQPAGQVGLHWQDHLRDVKPQPRKTEVSFASLQQSTSQYLTNLQRNIYLLRDVLRHCIEGTVVASYLFIQISVRRLISLQENWAAILFDFQTNHLLVIRR